MKIIFVSSEIVPFVSTGGLGDVAAALPEELVRQNVDVVRMLPLYADIDREKFGLQKCEIELHIPLGHSWYFGTVWKNEFNGVTTYFIHNEEFFDRPGLYGHDGHGYADNFERFLFFQKAIVTLIDEWNLQPDVVHCNAWQTALIPMFLDHGIYDPFRNGKEKTLFTIHNLSHQGWAPAEKFYMTQLPNHCYTMETLEFYGEINTMKGGVVSANAINAVSPNYAKEIQTSAFGCRLDGVLREKSTILSGILNGIDYSRWDPEIDPHILTNYSVSDLAGKSQCKCALQKEAGFRPNPKVPLLGIITRLVPQKGIDLLVGAMDQLVETGAQLILLGTGDERYERVAREWAHRWPDQVCTWIEFSTKRAHQIEAGCDLFLMPSEFEPCGQNQLISLRYGTIPVVHGVGGLEDSIVDYADRGSTGFKFYGYTPEAFFQCVERALSVYQKGARWKPLMKRAMKQDFSVVHMAKEYISLYKTL